MVSIIPIKVREKLRGRLRRWLRELLGLDGMDDRISLMTRFTEKLTNVPEGEMRKRVAGVGENEYGATL